MAERDMERAEVAKATCHVGEMEQEIGALRDDQEQVSSPSGSVITLHEPPVDPKLLIIYIVVFFLYKINLSVEDGDQDGSVTCLGRSCGQRQSGDAESAGGGA